MISLKIVLLKSGRQAAVTTQAEKSMTSTIIWILLLYESIDKNIIKRRLWIRISNSIRSSWPLLLMIWQ